MTTPDTATMEGVTLDQTAGGAVLVVELPAHSFASVSLPLV